MIQIILGGLLLSLIHAAIPNHWLPFVAIGKAEKYSRKEILFITAIAGGAHTLSTILIGFIIGFAGYKLYTTFEIITRIVAPSILVALGIIYLYLDFRHSHHHHHHDHNLISSTDKKKSKIALIISLSVAMFFSPCLEIEAYYFTAGTLGWLGILTFSMIYLFVTVLGMVLLVDLGYRGVEKIRWKIMDHHEKKITGLVLVILGIFAFFIKI